MVTFLTAIAMLAGLALIGAVFTSQSLTDRVRIYDLVKFEIDTRLTRTSGTIKNPSSTTATQGQIQVGYPVKLVATQWTLLLSGDEANCGGLYLGDPATQPFMEQLAQNAISALPQQILFGGPAIVDQTKIATTDVAGASFTLATLITALAGLKGAIRPLAEPTTSLQQTK
jgi:hypothetical protein